MRQPGRIIDRTLKVLLEVLESKPAGTDELAFEGLRDKWLELRKAKHRNGALPTVPNKTFVLRIDLGIAGAQKPNGLGTRHLPALCHHCDHFAHTRADEFVR